MIKSKWGLVLAGLIAIGCTEKSTSADPDPADAAIDALIPPPVIDARMGEGADAALPIDHCADDATTDFNESAEALEDGGWRYEGEYNLRGNFAGSCGGEGREAVFRFAAPSAGRWAFHSGPVEGELDTVLYARSDCADVETELSCNDDIENQVILESSLQLNLEEGQLIYLFADTFGGTGKPFFLTARTIPVAAIGEACDRSGQRTGCPPDAYCRVAPDADEDEGVCAPDTPPGIDELRAFRAGNLITVQVDGHDDGADVTEGRLQLYRGNQRIVLNQQGADTFIIRPIESVYGETTFVFRFRAGLDQEAWQAANRIRFWLRDARENDGEAVATELADLPAAADGCDQHRILDGCPSGTACLDRDEDGTYLCANIQAPEITRVKGFLNRNAPSLAFDRGARGWVVGFEVRGFDPDEDVTGIGLHLVKRTGARVEAERAACGAEDECDEGLRCVDGACLTPCETDAECGARQLCGEGNLCAAGCRALEEGDTCPDGEYCDETSAPDDHQCADNIAQGNFQFGTLTSTDGEFDGFVSFRLAQEFDFDHVRLRAIDAEGLESEPTIVSNLRPPADSDPGDECDPLGARRVCAVVCMPGDEGSVCGEPETPCPAEWGTVTEVPIEGSDHEWRIDGDLTNSPNVTRGTCGGGVAQNFYRFTAPTTGKYSFVARGRSADTTVYVRRYCGVGHEYPNIERGCSTGIGRRFRYGLVRGALQAGETVYVIVDGGEGWRGAYQFVAERLPDHEDVDF